MYPFPSICNACGLKKWFVKKRTYSFPKVSSVATSQGELCPKCYRGIRNVIKKM